MFILSLSYAGKLSVNNAPKSVFHTSILYECLITFIKVDKSKNSQRYIRISFPFFWISNFSSYVTPKIHVRHVLSRSQERSFELFNFHSGWDTTICILAHDRDWSADEARRGKRIGRKKGSRQRRASFLQEQLTDRLEHFHQTCPFPSLLIFLPARSNVKAVKVVLIKIDRKLGTLWIYASMDFIISCLLNTRRWQKWVFEIFGTRPMLSLRLEVNLEREHNLLKFWGNFWVKDSSTVFGKDRW